MSDSLDEKYPGRSVHREGNQIVVTIPVKFYRRNGRQMVSTKAGAGSPTRSQASSNETLVAAIAKAWAWQAEFESGIVDGRFQSLEDFAKEKAVDRSYAGRLLRLNSLSPALTEQVLNGDEPNEISLRKLAKGFSLKWSEQTNFSSECLNQ